MYAHMLVVSTQDRAILFSGLDYCTGILDWTDIFFVFAHYMVGFIEFRQLTAIW